MPSMPPPKYEYVPVSDDEEKIPRAWPSRESHAQFTWSGWVFLLLFATSSFFLGGLVGFGAGKASMLDVSYDVPLEPLSIAFRSNRTFLQRPSNESNAIWSSLYPGNHGFFNYPDKNPRRSTFAGFHQLHCVDTLRRGFYQVWDAKTALENGTNPAHLPPESITLNHVLHCIEFLRQSVMCHADTTIEAKDENLHGVVGFGIAHACRNWDQMVKWVEDRNAREL
ncbi:hypothetical protein GJ744_009426 [Endocarpon pusillum]|uniref:Tat pathway signal sequence n=1 Tax=Endocarpon pusillum TaxID=364733 RepID=A0A8H7AJQ2_9EURO|nr:hypothetical protein GJ744_009426 [Endocarpon pusillum]